MAKLAINFEDWSEQETDFNEFLTEQFAPPSEEPTEVFAEHHVILQDGPFAGSHWRLLFTPFAQWIFAGIRKAGVRRVTIMMSAQYLKTITLIISFLRNAKEDPSDTMWVMAEADQMAEFIEKRLMPYIESCDVVEPLLRGKKKSLVQFESFNLLLRGSNSRAKLQSDPIRRVYCDERREWKKGSIDLLRKRMRTFPNAQEVSAGTAGIEHDELHSDYLEGTQTRAHIKCLKCGHSQPIRFSREKSTIWKQPRECGGFVGWSNDTNPGIESITRPNGIWDYEAVRKHVYFECENPACRHRFTNADKYELIRTMHPHDYNPSAPPDKVSFGGSAFEAIWESCDWDKLVIEFLKAVEEAKRGNVEPLKAFITETLGEPWQDQLGAIEDYEFLEGRKQDYQFGEVWPEEFTRFMAADRQEAGGEHYWWVIRAFNQYGRSRLIACGRATSTLELEQMRVKYTVPVNNAMIDSGFKASEVYKFCMSNRWKPFKGDDTDYFYYRNERLKKTLRRIWERTFVDPFIGTAYARKKTLPLFRFANNPTKDLLMTHMTGLSGEWSIPKTSPKEYLRQMTAERRTEVVDVQGRVKFVWQRKIRDNHFWDCELMIMVAAVINRLARNAPVLPETPPASGQKPA